MDDCCSLVLPYNAIQSIQQTEQIPNDPPRMGAKSTTTSNHPSTAQHIELITQYNEFLTQYIEFLTQLYRLPSSIYRLPNSIYGVVNAIIDF